MDAVAQQMMRVAVVGSRTFSNLNQVTNILDRLHASIGPFLLVSGGAAGVDQAAEKWAKLRQLETKIFPADWDRDGKKAGVLRNAHIIEHSDLVIAFWDGVSPGTLDTIVRAKKSKRHKIQVYLG